MPYAVIDLGTNTFNLLIAEQVNGKLTTLFSEKWPVLLGLSGITKSTISNDALKRSKECLTEFKNHCDDWNVIEVKAFGTSALRDAKNTGVFQEIIYSLFRIKAEIISGEREAELIFKGVSEGHKFQSDSLIIDIGGGSTEFIHLSEGSNSMSSLDIGVTRIHELLGYPIEFENYHFENILKVLEQSAPNINSFHHETLIGCSGSFETFAELILERRMNNLSTSLKLDFSEFNKVLDWTLGSTSQERENNEWIIPLRKKLLPISALMVKWVLERFNTNEIYLSPFSLKEGAFSEMRHKNLD